MAAQHREIMVKGPRGNGIALVDTEDFDRLNASVWYLCKQGYAYMVMNGTTVKMHRSVLDYKGDDTIDHKNGVKLDNRRSNLRIATNSQNISNRRKYAGGSSRFKGVCFDKNNNRWLARISINRNQRNLGRYVCEDDAARAYDVAAREVHGPFACVNFPEADERGAV